MLSTGSVAPPFRLPDASGKEHALEDYRGRWVLVYFYPKDGTAGCTKEACAFREAFDEYQRKGVVILGISRDSVESHIAFKNKYNLPFTILSDVDLHVIVKYKAKTAFGVKRISYLVSPDGIIAKAYPKVDPETHAEEVLSDVEKLSQEHVVAPQM